MPTLFCCDKITPIGILSPVLTWLPAGGASCRIRFSLFPDFSVIYHDTGWIILPGNSYRPPCRFPGARRIYWQLILQTDAGQTVSQSWFETGIPIELCRRLGSFPTSALPLRWGISPDDYPAARMYFRCTTPAVLTADGMVCLRTERAVLSGADITAMLSHRNSTTLELRPFGQYAGRAIAEGIILLRRRDGRLLSLPTSAGWQA